MKITQNRVGIVLVHFSGLETTRSCLDSLSVINSQFQKKIYVIAMANRDATVIQAHPIKPWVMTTEVNLGYAGGVNIGIKQAIKEKNDFLVILNNDVLVSKDFLDPLVEQLKNVKVGLVSPKIYFAPNHEYHQRSYTKNERGRVIWYAGGIIDWQNMDAYHWGVDEVDHGQFEMAIKSDFATGCCLAFRRDLVEKAGLMREDYFLYWEDVEWSIRVKRAGYKIMFEPKSVIWHVNAGSSGGAGSEIHQYYQTRNRLVFGLDHAPFKTKLALIKLGIKQLAMTNTSTKKGVRDGFLRRMGKKS